MKRTKLFRPMHIQFFAEDTGATGMSDLDAMLGEMDNQAEETQTEETTETDAGTEEQTEPEQQTEPEKPKPQDKSNVAFAQMRTTISQQKALLTKLAQAAGIEFTNEADLVAKLSDSALTELAKKQNVPVELMKRLEMLEQDSQTLRQTKLQDAAFLGFQKVMKEYELTQDELTAFAAELDEAGKNPFVQELDVITEYKLLHYDDILNKRVEKAVQAALSKSQAADKHSTTPTKQRGTNPSSAQAVSTVQGLDDLLKGMK